MENKLKHYRSALGMFTTGITIVTTRSANGEPVGMTANSFGSLSLEPPLVLWSLSIKAKGLKVYSKSEYFAVHVLTAEQVELSKRFARTGEDKFSGLSLEEGLGGSPLIAGCAARFQCKSESLFDGGDHLIMVGRVMQYEYTPEANPLLYFQGSYARGTEILSKKN